MTYKNTKFEDSAVMRSLERVAIAKGLIEPEILKKEAATKPEESPKTLSEKILKLCEGLRGSGFQKYAEEIENKFLVYKKAENSLYDITKEEGKDLIDFAHQEGGKKLDKNWSDLGTVETILEQHEKIVEVVNKKPKGKLASKHIINAVKIVLAQEAADPLDTVVEDGGAGDTSSEEDSAQKYFLHLIKRTASLVSSIENTYGKKLSDWSHVDPGAQTDNEASLGYSTFGTTKGFLDNILENLTAIQEMPISADAVDELKKNLRSFRIVVNKANNISANYKVRYTAQADAILKDTDKVISLLHGENPGAAKAPTATQPSVAPANSIPASKYAKSLGDALQWAKEKSVILSQATANPKLLQDTTKKNYLASIDALVQKYITNLNQVIENLSALGDQPIAMDNIAQVTQGTSFATATSTQKFAAMAKSFTDAIEKVLKVIQGW